MEIKTKLNELKERQQTVSELIDLGQVLVKVNGRRRLEVENAVTAETVFENEKTCITIATFKTEGGLYPSHCHNEIIEYLICLSGSCGITLPNNGYRILKEQECAKIPASVMHSVISLEANSDIMAICLPAEPAYINDKGVKVCQT